MFTVSAGDSEDATDVAIRRYDHKLAQFNSSALVNEPGRGILWAMPFELQQATCFFLSARREAAQPFGIGPLSQS